MRITKDGEDVTTNWEQWFTNSTASSTNTNAIIDFIEQKFADLGSTEWEAILAVEGVATSDGRYLMPGKIEWRDLPLTLMVQTITADGHDGAFAAGKITRIYKEKRPDLGPGAVAIMGAGSFSSDADGVRARQLLAEEIVRGVSIDFAPSATYLLDPDTLEVVNEEDLGLEALLGGTSFLRGFEGSIMGATMCPFQAFEDATMRIIELPDKVVVASAFKLTKVLTASGAGIAPLEPQYDWFFLEEPDQATPLTVTDDGQVFGHLAVWNQCHRAMRNSCELAPRSPSKYAFFHTGQIKTEDGRKVNVGRITVDTGHASTDPSYGMNRAIAHYDNTGTVAAYVRATDGKHGIWLSGAVRSDCPAEKVRDLAANPPSGDWRAHKRDLELGAILSVPMAGFPVPRYEASLVASGNEENVVAMIAMGYSEKSMEFTRAEIRQIEKLKASARKHLDAA